VGQSESAILLPIIYEKLAQKNRITALIAIAGGGLSLYQDYKIFSDEKSFPQKYKVQLKKLLYFYDTKSPQMNSTETAYLSMPYPYFAGFFSLQPADYYKSITIPVLFVHGEKDKNVPVESTRYMQKYFPDNHFDYLYYPKMAHGPSGHIAIVQFRNDISAWIMKHTK
jgi:pimeloyl-ACP methyl ester carboxylesterase